jgi:N-acetylglucosamine-6-phosphate deacetylase
VKVLIGATAIVSPGAQPIEDSIVIVSGRRIRSVGMRRDIPIPQDSERVDLTGKQIVPGDGSRIAVGEDSNIVVEDSAGRIQRRLIDGEWR